MVPTTNMDATEAAMPYTAILLLLCCLLRKLEWRERRSSSSSPGVIILKPSMASFSKGSASRSRSRVWRSSLESSPFRYLKKVWRVLCFLFADIFLFKTNFQIPLAILEIALHLLLIHSKLLCYLLITVFLVIKQFNALFLFGL